ncbi:CatB-related O-acetyltransferase [Mycolicibacterium litorale]|uniref:CatB-related O-acetyltransferase n=1 Tax=Mycolicibacterium litorale TaxID=758802 RepID=UPI003CF16000
MLINKLFQADTTQHPTTMRNSWVGRLLTRNYGRIPLRTKWLSLIVRLEGGQLYSATLRAVLKRWYQVDVGPYSYGSLLTPGNADRYTVIGSYVSIGPNVRRIGAAHPLSELSLHPFWYNPSLGMAHAGQDVQRTEIHIGDDSWIGANAVILPGCRRIGVGAVIGAGSIVTKDVEDFSVVAGNPAKPIGSRLTEDQRAELMYAKPWARNPIEADKLLADIRSRLAADPAEDAGPNTKAGR